ncbi:unnamed protein product, partial [marine sediment metagenome]
DTIHRGSIAFYRKYVSECNLSYPWYCVHSLLPSAEKEISEKSSVNMAANTSQKGHLC